MRDALRPSRGRGDPHPVPDIGDGDPNGRFRAPPARSCGRPGILHDARRDRTPGDIYRSIIPFVLVMVVALALVMIFPGLALWLPEQHYGR